MSSPDGWTLGVWHSPAPVRRFVEPVVLCHGVATDARIFDAVPGASVVRALGEAGFEVYLIELRGTESSRPPELGVPDADFDDFVRHDAPAQVQHVLRHSGASRCFWLGHSLGGLVGLVHAALTEESGARVAGVAVVGTPLFFRLEPWQRWVLRLARMLAAPGGALGLPALTLAVAPFAGRVPLRPRQVPANLENLPGPALSLLLANAFAPFPAGLLAQLDDWVTHDVVRSRDRRTDYRARIEAAGTPTLLLGGSVDALAPPDVQREAFGRLRTSDLSLVLRGRAFGTPCDYGHADLLVGTAAARDVYPVLVEWLVRRASPTTQGAAGPGPG